MKLKALNMFIELFAIGNWNTKVIHFIYSKEKLN